MLLIRRKISQRTQSAQKQEKHTHKLRIWKNLTEQIHFQMNLELQEVSDVTKAKWNERLLADLRSTLRGVEWVNCLFLFPFVLGKM